MRFSRVIFAVLIGLALVVSLAPANPLAATAAPAAAEGCCQGTTDKGADGDGDPCDRASCTMQCCRVIPAQAEPVPPLARAMHETIDSPSFIPVELHSLTDPEAIFHPPRA